MKRSALVVSMLVAPCLAKAQQVAPESTTLRYQVEARLIYLDLFERPDTGVIAPAHGLAMQTTEPEPGPRSLGLETFRMAFEWQAANATRLSVVLRPDALSRDPSDGPVLDFGNKAGVDMHPGEEPELDTPPTIKFLDAYELGLRAGESLDLSAGVYEALSRGKMSYRPLIGFGLLVRFPSKFSGLKLRWENLSDPPPTAAQTARTGVTVDLYGFQGDEDRVEKLHRDEDSYDRAPVAADPYQGGAVDVGWLIGPALELGLLAGAYDQKQEGGGRRTETFAGAAFAARFPVGPRAAKLSLDFRYATRKWRGTEVDIADRTRQSASLTGSIEAVSGLWALLGTHVGRAEIVRAPDEIDAIAPVNGLQVELGMLSQLGKGLFLQGMIAEEQRDVDFGDGDEGGFRSASGDSRRTLRRMALELSYLLEGRG